MLHYLEKVCCNATASLCISLYRSDINEGPLLKAIFYIKNTIIESVY